MKPLTRQQLQWAIHHRDSGFHWWAVARQLNIDKHDLLLQVRQYRLLRPDAPPSTIKRRDKAAERRRAMRRRNWAIRDMLKRQPREYVAAYFGLSERRVFEIGRTT